MIKAVQKIKHDCNSHSNTDYKWVEKCLWRTLWYSFLLMIPSTTYLSHSLFFLNFMTIFALVPPPPILNTKVHESRPNWVVNDKTPLKKMVCLMLRSQDKVWRRKTRWPTDFLMTKSQLKLFWEMVVTTHPFCNLDGRHGQVGPRCVACTFLPTAP